ncbi:hypothetical protein ACWGI8_28565 [Streptomyces sp. NPDC054841]
MGRRIQVRHLWRSTPAPGTVAHDTHWAGDLRQAFCCAALLLGLLLVVDAGNGTLGVVRCALWTGTALLLFLILLPARVAAGHDWLETRNLTRTRRVRTDRLVTAHWSDGVAQRLVLRDADGGHVQLDPRVLALNPRLWYLLDEGARVSRDRGTLQCGGAALQQLSGRIDAENAKAIFRISGLDD